MTVVLSSSAVWLQVRDLNGSRLARRAVEMSSRGRGGEQMVEAHQGHTQDKEAAGAGDQGTGRRKAQGERPSRASSPLSPPQEKQRNEEWRMEGWRCVRRGA
jgi:hypothetical protein